MGAALAGALMLAGCDDSPPGAVGSAPGQVGSPSPVATAAPREAPTRAPTASATVTESAGAAPTPAVPVVKVYPRGATVDDLYGVLFLDPSTGGGTLWVLPQNSRVEVPSPSGRYVAWFEPAAASDPGGGPGAPHLLDTVTGADHAATYRGAPLQVVAFAPDDLQFAAVAGIHAAIFDSASLTPVVELPDLPTPAVPRAEGEAEWSPDGSAVAVVRFGWTEPLIDVVRKGTVQRLAIGGGAVQWSRRGDRLAVAGLRATLVYDFEKGTELAMPGAGHNPRWSPDDRYIAVIAADDDGLTRIFDSRSGEEVLRVGKNGQCVGEYWYADGTIFGWGAGQVTVPGGGFVPFETDGYVAPDATSRPSRAVEFGQDGTRLVEDGVVLAEVSITTPAVSTFFDSDGLHGVLPGGLGVVHVGRGGKDLCFPGQAPRGVYFPPFDI